MAAESHSPLEQFTIKRHFHLDLGTVDASFTNSSVSMVIVVILISALMIWGMSRRAMVPGRLQSTAELAYEFIAGMVQENIGAKGKKYFPFIFSLFMFILFSNMLGMVPYQFTATSHIIVTFAMALFVFIGVTLIGLARHGLHFFSYFLPPGVPMWLAPLIVPIEVLSYLSRPISLSLRLFANMLAGHTMMKVFAGFVVALGFVAGWAPLLFVVALTGLEILIAFLQAYVFTILTCLYLSDAIHLEH